MRDKHSLKLENSLKGQFNDVVRRLTEEHN